ncbi:MAG: class I SAM-dependent methyltransferase family protein [Candidatus Diapherotrites archaeon]|nr:class I SAM-dependent methyltransferase family protein [Candidatus Diapherotrites archaeon]
MEKKASLLFGLAVGLKDAEKAKRFIIEKNLFVKGIAPKKSKGSITFPLAKKLSAGEMKTFGAKAKHGKFKFEKSELKQGSLKERLKGKLSGKELESLISSYDQLGDTAIIEIPPELEKKEKIIAKALLDSGPNIKTVAKITGVHSGEFRVRPVEIIAGEKKGFALYREAGCEFRIALGKVFFSPRLGTERLRISKLIRPGEVVGAFFAGVGPFPIVFAKNSPMQKAVAIELNPEAVRLMRENVVLNRCSDKIEIIEGDVNRVCLPKFGEAFDRIVMPLPKGGETFLQTAVACAKKGGVIHFYRFAGRQNPFEQPLAEIAEACQKQGRKSNVLLKRRVRSFSASTVQVVVDFRVR